MPINTTLASLSTNPALNGPDGSTDLPSVLDDAIRNALAFIAQLRDGTPTGGSLLWMTGMVAQFAMSGTPVGWLKLNGQVVNRASYPSLWAFAQASGLLVAEATWSANQWGCFGVGDGSTTFRVPDMRGMTPKGADEGRGMDPGRTAGSFQDHAVLSHTHGVNDPSHQHGGGTTTAGNHQHGGSTDTQGAHVHAVENFVYNDFPSAAGFPAVAGNLGIGTKNTTTSGNHAHNIVTAFAGDHAHNIVSDFRFTGISIQAAGHTYNQVRNVAWPFFIKY